MAEERLARPSLSSRVLVRLAAAELRELNPHWQDDYRISWITVRNAAQCVPEPHVVASYAVLGLHPSKVWPAIVERRKALLGPFYVDESLPPKKPCESVCLVEEPVRRVAGEEFCGKQTRREISIISRRLKRVEEPGMAASTATASHKPDDGPRGIYEPKEFYRLAERLPIPGHLQRTFRLWYAACGNPTGETIEFFATMKKFARKAMICDRTARSHVQRFEQLGLVSLRPKSPYRTKAYRLNIAPLYHQSWERCQCCGHRHENGHCGHSLGARRIVFRVGSGKQQKRAEKVVERVCRCAAAAHPGPVPVVQPEAPKPAASATRPNVESALPYSLQQRLSLAAKLLMEMCGLPPLPERSAHVESAILAEAKMLGIEVEQAGKHLTECALRDQKEGVTLNRFYFLDCKWRSRGTQQTKLTAAQSRSERSKQSLLNALGELHRRDREAAGGTDSPDPPELED
ncbi:MAG TPA: hypothetical protein VMQ17_08865 [Candidatus Sulfotelmatobacter sp.]|nr:hypothetical protein [Candidatus Sulfotelmatobacter sp.]